jgi:hypothetical protein
MLFVNKKSKKKTEGGKWLLVNGYWLMVVECSHTSLLYNQ